MLDLLEDGTDWDTKIITEEIITSKPKEGKEEIKISTRPDVKLRSITPDDLNKIISTPLIPAYHATRKVSRVWAKDMRVEHLYMKSNFDRLVYPPSFIV